MAVEHRIGLVVTSCMPLERSAVAPSARSRRTRAIAARSGSAVPSRNAGSAAASSRSAPPTAMWPTKFTDGRSRAGSRRRSSGSRVAELPARTSVGRRVERRRLGVEDHEPRAVAHRELGEGGRGVARRATCRSARKTSAAGAARSRAIEVRGDEVLAERDRRPTSASRRTRGTAGPSSPARTRSSVSSIGPRQPQSRHFASWAVPWISTTIAGDEPGALVQPVDVLGDERVERRRGARARRARGARRWARRPTWALPTRSCHAVCGASRDAARSTRWSRAARPRGSFVQTPSGPRKSGMPALGRDPRAGQHDDLPGVAQPARDARPRRRSHEALDAMPRDASTGRRAGGDGRADPAATAGRGSTRPRPGCQLASGCGGRGGERFAVTVVGPAGALVAERGWKPMAWSTRSTWSGSSPCSSSVNATRRARRRAAASGWLGELGLGPFGVRGLHVGREATQVPGVHRWHVAAHRDGVGVRVGAGEVELLEAPQRAHDRRARALAVRRARAPRTCRRAASSTPSGLRSKRSARWRNSSSAVGPRVGSQNVSA